MEHSWELILKNSISLQWQPEFFDGIKFCEQFLKRTYQGTFLPSLVQIGRAVWEKMFKEIADDGHQVILNPFPNKPWFLRVCSISLLKSLWEKEKLL